jgi:hypothetical protein
MITSEVLYQLSYVGEKSRNRLIMRNSELFRRGFYRRR